MRERFRKWLVNRGNEGAAKSYPGAVNRVSKHYSENTGVPIDGNQSLLAIELKSGVADFKVFGQMSMYVGLLKQRFPDKEVKGLIISGSIDESFQKSPLPSQIWSH
jgi:hypothetical protein